KQAIDEAVDHRLVLPVDNELGSLVDDGEQIKLEWHYQSGTIRMNAPQQSVLALPAVDVSKGAMTRYLIQLVESIVHGNVKEVLIHLREEDTGTSPYYHYCHGLRHHDGNCQRIAHGHRSRVVIRENGR